MSHPPRAAAYTQRIVPEPPAPQPPGEESLSAADKDFLVRSIRGARSHRRAVAVD
jgi:hypothetical protein